VRGRGGGIKRRANLVAQVLDSGGRVGGQDPVTPQGTPVRVCIVDPALTAIVCRWDSRSREDCRLGDVLTGDCITC